MAAEIAEWLGSMINMDAPKHTKLRLIVNRGFTPRQVARIDDSVRQLATDAGLELSAHLLRHTCVTNLVRAGTDLVLVAELAGHRRLDTTRRYSLPSEADRDAAVEALVPQSLVQSCRRGADGRLPPGFSP